MKKLLPVTLILCLVVLVVQPPEAARAQPAPFITAPSAVLFDYNTNQIIYSKTPNLKRAPASTVKLLTAMVVMDHRSLGDVVRIPKGVERIEPSKINLRSGERYSVRDLIRATLMNSANDAAESLAIAVGGSRWQFAKLMNAKARSIGCTHSHFVMASGLPASNQYSTAYDMALIMKEIQNYPFLVETLKIRGMSIKSMSGRSIYLKSHNRMLWRDPREVVGKTGWTRAARYCFVGHARVASRMVVVAMLGSNHLWTDLKKLIDFSFGGVVYYTASQTRKVVSDRRVRRLQMALRKAGFNPGAVDGRYGRQTRRAVKRFQRANGLPTTGYAGTLTWKKLERYL
ncbi:MAG: peptidoglycan-binding protein [Candidatus Omnitrophica bacterium]|nr:peptidoglycan-binding protein [Candidatus Omnitrophota bacterium]MDD5671610.1 peptidoglycan-binding protein [Candidatus Omnitrophota bacterium]